MGLLLTLGFFAPDGVGRLVAWPEARIHQNFGNTAGAIELSLPHGIGFGERGHELLGRGGLRMATDGNVEALVLGVGTVVSPFAWRLRPILATEVGGYALLLRSRPADEAADLLGPRWLWSLRASGGVHADLWWGLGLRVLADVTWIQKPVTVVSTGLESGWGAGAAVTWALPFDRISDRLPAVFQP